MGLSKKLKNFFIPEKNASTKKGIALKEREHISVEDVPGSAIKQENNLLEVSWDKFSSEEQRNLVKELYYKNWRNLITQYHQYDDEREKIRIIEILAYIPNKEVVDFLINEMKSAKETIRLSASASLRKQDTRLTLEPMLYALTQPNQWLPSRVLDVLKDMGPILIKPLTDMVKKSDPKVQSILIQVLGEVGDKSCLSVFSELAGSSDDVLRLRVVEALKTLALKESLPVLIILLEDEKWQIRMHAAEALGKIKMDLAEPVLKERLKIEDDDIVKDCIQDALENINKETLPDIIYWVREG